MEMSDYDVSEPFVKPDAVQGQVFVFRVGIGDAGVEVQNPLLFQGGFQTLVQRSTDSALMKPPFNVNGRLSRTKERGAGMERSGVGVTDKAVIDRRDKIRIPLERLFHSLSDFLCRRGDVFKRNRRLSYVRRVYRCDSFRVVVNGRSYNHI